MEVCHCDLLAATDTHPLPPPQVESARDQAGRKENLFVSRQRSVRPEGRIDFHFRPQLAQHAVPKGGIVRHGRAAFLAASGGDGPANRALKIKIAKAFAESKGRRDRSVVGGEAAVWNTAGKKSSHDVIPLFFIRRQEPIFQSQGNVAEPVRALRRHLVGRHAENDFRVLRGNQLQALASEIIQAVAGGGWRPGYVGAKLFFQARSSGVERSDPMGLFGRVLVTRGNQLAKCPAAESWAVTVGTAKAKLSRTSAP